MKKPTLIATAAMLVLSATANAQVTVDVAKITCDQFAGFKITDPHNIAIWLSGYYNGKRDNTVIDTQALQENYNKLRDYCIVNQKVTVFQAAQTLFGPAK
jgi:acid stress chaperone HdeB